MEKVKVKILNTNKIFEFDSGISIFNIAAAAGGGLAQNAYCAKINNKLVDLSYSVKINSEIEFLDYYTAEGRTVYRKTATFILEKAVKELYPSSKLIVGMHIEGGYYFDFEDEKTKLNKAVLNKIENKMKDIIKNNVDFERKLYNFSELIEHFKKLGLEGKIKIVQMLNKGGINVYKLGDFLDLAISPLAPSSGYIKAFELVKHGDGFLLRFPSKKDMTKIPPKKNQKKLFQIYLETKDWYKILKIEDVGDLNKKIEKNEIGDIIKVAEALHEKKIAQIADEITARKDQIKFILIAGPSSSGKTTFSKRLEVALKVNGITPFSISLDDYYIDRVKTPRDENGEYDFEAVEAINLKLLNAHLKKLLEGKKINLPHFDFKTGISSISKRQIQILPGQIAILEGIHGLNERLTKVIPGKNKYKIFISALTQLRLSSTSRIATTDTRLVRRMVRDYRYRGYSAQDTISRWPSVRNGESKHIFPFQENADAVFNSGIVYEFSVLKAFAIPILKKVTTAEKEYPEAQRLLSILELFDGANTKSIPPTSLLREFIGGSSFHY